MALLAGLGVVLLTGCSSAVEVTAPPQAGSPACTAAASHWPTTVSGQDRVETTAGSDAVAAWGDPPVIARCGLSALAPTTEQCLDVNGVDWVVRKASDGAVFTTFGRDPAIEVLVPNAYAPEPLLLPAFGAAAKALPANGHSCK
ncbi:Protein of unknown function [Pedococcus cremeus]|uniref:DUF3515 domain-containing protein n=1 Tax=Pedococcus cremeus TaxID=587636 RepID=A0A1H9R9F8_9MICO|nr:DUF3515 family protein [Pedococcus cremeus]SER68573.1 Protein of unknown function [Pedococcus cremeus]